jgi:hydroxymethylpyrimidine pyrophosphatase-like HAD family hydrolase
MKYDAIFVDLDRTLLRNDKSVSDYTISILKKCKELGIKIIVASARPLRNIVYFDSLQTW